MKTTKILLIARRLFILVFISGFLSLSLLILMGKPGYSNLQYDITYGFIHYFLRTSLMTLMGYGSYLGFRRYLDEKKAIIAAGMILLVLFGGILVINQKNYDYNEKMCLDAIEAQCAATSKAEIAIPNRCLNGDELITERLNDEIEVGNKTVLCESTD